MTANEELSRVRVSLEMRAVELEEQRDKLMEERTEMEERIQKFKEHLAVSSIPTLRETNNWTVSCQVLKICSLDCHSTRCLKEKERLTYQDATVHKKTREPKGTIHRKRDSCQDTTLLKNGWSKKKHAP